jgi:hypothetical protein
MRKSNGEHKCGVDIDVYRFHARPYRIGASASNGGLDALGSGRGLFLAAAVLPRKDPDAASSTGAGRLRDLNDTRHAC